MLTNEIIQMLQTIVGEPFVSQTEADRQLHGRDLSSHPAHLPEVVVWPSGREQVSQIAHLAHTHKIPLVGWGAGSSLEGNPIPLQGGIVVNFGRMNHIVKIHEQDFQITVQPGVLYKDMNKVLAQYGLFFAPDPGANASIGGMIANNAAGSRTVKYGATRDNVLALEVVLANGTIIRTGSRSVKQSAGYDLTHLFTGSEGTLGLITEATLKLVPLPEHFSAVSAAFPTTQQAAAAVFQVMGAGLNPAALELLDKTSVEILCEGAGFNFPRTPNLFMEFHGASTTSLAEELKLVQEICLECGCTHFQSGLGLEARNKLWEARHGLFEIMVRHFPGREWLITDVSVPISHYPTLVGHAAEWVEELTLKSAIFGHAGDGNMHTTTFYDPHNPEEYNRAKLFNERVVSQALQLEGTCTGEHGVGIGKQKYMVREHGAEAITVMQLLKQALDPHQILNPGKVIAASYK